MSTIGKVIGYLLLVGSGIIMFFFWFTAMTKWLGFFGGVLAFIFTPGAVIFPVVFWIVEGVFPAFYFMIWGVGLVGMVIAGLSSSD